MNAMSSDAMNISFLVRNFAERVTGVRDAIVVSADGLLMAMSAGLTRESADRFAAAASGLIGLAHGAAAPFGGGRVTEVIIEMEYGFIFVTGIGEGSSLLRSRFCDGLAFLGVHLDAARNESHAPVISTAQSPVTVHLIKTDEELQIARESARVLTRGVR